MISVKKVSKIYCKGNQQIKAIDNLSIEIPSGDYLSIVGSSGSGKSTFLQMLGGMLSPSSGSVWIDQCSIYDLKPDNRAAIRKKKIGFVFQNFNLIPYLTALQNIQVPLLLNCLDEKVQYEKAKQLLERVGLSNRSEHKPSELSIGQQQRVALARMLANDPEIILADEPTGNLDPETSQQIITFLNSVNKEGKTIVLVTHDMNVASQARRTITIETGGKFAE